MKLINYISKSLHEFITEIQNRIKDRFLYLFKIFKWPKPSYKLSRELTPLNFTSIVDEEFINLYPINQIIREHPRIIINKIDDRLELFLCYFIFGLRLQYAFNQFQYKNNDDSLEISKIWVLDILFEPIINRFQFHFMNKYSDTYKLDKPEWFCTFIANILNDHAEFLINYIQPILNKESKFIIQIPDSKNILIGKFIDIVIEKLKVDIPVLLRDNQSLYCHTLSECKKLENLLFDVHNYPENYISPIQAFIDNKYFLKACIQIENYGNYFNFYKKNN